MKEITPQKEQELAEFHQQWLMQPVTRQALSLLEGHKELIIGAIIKGSSNADEGSDLNLRVCSVQLKTVNSILQFLSNTEIFVAKVKQPNNQ